MTLTRPRKILRAVAVSVAVAGLVGAVAPSAQAATPAAYLADIYVTPSSSLVLPGTLELLAYQQHLRLMGPKGVRHPDNCPADPAYAYAQRAANKISAVPTIYGDPGVYISISLTAGASATATFTGTTQAGASVVIANASVTYGVAFSFSITASVTYTGAWTVPTTAPHYGYLGAGAYSDSYLWNYGEYVNCVWKVLSSGSMNSPYHLPYIWKGTA